MSSDSDNEPSEASSIIHSVMESLQRMPPLPQSHYVSGSAASSSYGVHRQRRIHDLLGGGHAADVLLWRQKHLSAGFLAGTTVLWILFEWIGYHFISVISFLLLGFVAVLFTWSNIAYFLNRAPPPVPKLQLSDSQVHDIAKTISVQLNKALGNLHDIATGKDLPRFLKLVGALSLLVLFGSWFHLLTLVYLGVVAAHTLPVFYEKHGDSIDQVADSAWKEINNQYKRFDANVLSRIPRKQSTFDRKSN